MKFWDSASAIRLGSPEYTAAFSAASKTGTASQGKFRSIILHFLDRQDFAQLAPRTQVDMRRSVSHPENGIDAKFGDAPIAAMEDPRIRTQALDWRDKIGGKVGDDRLRHLQRIIGFAHDRGRIRAHQLQNVKGIYKSQRAEIFWMPEEVERFEAGAPAHVWRILAIALETGLRPGDLSRLAPEHIHCTPRAPRRDVDAETQATGVDPGHGAHGRAYRCYAGRTVTADGEQGGSALLARELSGRCSQRVAGQAKGPLGPSPL
ncbi:hypothetical protein [Paracoccus beibuensis]|uniref:hypothetical protein n=1 Tax=Paracoccus beibuensis TaxID=547602 RepID=UPI00223E92DA|nr:hypothetical protein [Paracoccus beibuensis]